MKILYVTQHHPDFAMGGAEQILLDLAVSMREDFKVQVHTAVNEGSLAEVFRKMGFSVSILPWNKSQSFEMLCVLKKTAAEFKPDLIHSFHRYPSFLLVTFLGEKQRLIYTEEVLRKDKKLLFRYGRLAIACHETVRKNLIDFYKIPESKTITIPNAVRSQVPDPETLEKIRKQYFRPAGEMWALCIARLEEQKGHTYLIDAYSKLSESHKKKLRIFLAGDGSLAKSLEAQAQKAGCGDRIVFLGHTKHISEWLMLCDFKVLPSLWEGLPLSILEAYSAAKPVLATDIPGNRESVKDKETGLLVRVKDPLALKDGLIYFLDHPADVFHFGRQAYNWWQEDFTFEGMSAAYHDLYKRLLARM